MPITRPPVILKPFAESGNKNTIPVDSQVGITDGAASFETGFPPDTMIDIGDGGIAPDGLDMNGILNIITQHIRFLLAGGYPRFDATLCTEIGGYPVGATLQDNNGVNIYRNILANNTTDFNTSPASIGVSWIWLTGQTRNVVAGLGLIGGGAPATADITLNMGTPATCSGETQNVATADSHTHAITSTPYATNAGYATSSESANIAGHATSSESANTATYATSSGSANTATYATSADYATSSGSANYAITAGSTPNAGNSDTVDGYHASTLLNVTGAVGNVGTYYYYDTAYPLEFPPTKFGGLWEYCGQAGADGHYFKLYRRYQ